MRQGCRLGHLGVEGLRILGVYNYGVQAAQAEVAPLLELGPLLPPTSSKAERALGACMSAFALSSRAWWEQDARWELETCLSEDNTDRSSIMNGKK